MSVSISEVESLFFADEEEDQWEDEEEDWDDDEWDDDDW
jgi:hypothetical protein